MATRVVKAGSTGVEFATAPQPLHIADLDSDLDSIYTNIDNTNVKVGAGIATAKLAQDAGIQTGHLAPLAVTTAKIAVGATRNGSVIGDATTLLNIGTTEGDIVPNTSITTRGGPIVVLSYIAASLNNIGGGSGTITIRLYRDAVIIKTWTTNALGITGTIPFPISVAFIDVPASGARLYKVTGQSGSVTNTIQTGGANPGSLVLLELA